MSIGIRKTFNLDMVPGGAPPIIHVSAEDVGRPYRAVLLYNGEVYEVQGNRLTIAGTKPDGTVFEYPVDDFEPDDSYADFTIKEQMAIVPGTVRCKIREYLNDDKIGSATFILDVDENVYNPDASSESDIATISDYVAATVNEYIEEHPESIVAVPDGGITTAKLADEAVTTAKLAAGAVTSAKVDTDLMKEIENAYVTPEMYGAVGDGTTDDTTAIQSALNSGKNVLFGSAKTYKVTDSLRCGGNIVIDLNGATINCTTYRVLLNYLSSDTFTVYNGHGNIIIRNGHIEGGCISFAHGQNILFENLTFNNGLLNHFIEICACKNFVVRDCYFGALYNTEYTNEHVNIDPCEASAAPTLNQASIDGTVNENIYVMNNVFEKLDGYMYDAVGVHFVPDATKLHKNINICGNIIRGAEKWAVSIWGCTKSLVDGNNMSCNEYGIRCGLGDSNVISNNTFLSNKQWNLISFSSNTTTTNLAVFGNDFNHKQHMIFSSIPADLTLKRISGGAVQILAWGDRKTENEEITLDFPIDIFDTILFTVGSNTLGSSGEPTGEVYIEVPTWKLRLGHYVTLSWAWENNLESMSIVADTSNFKKITIVHKSLTGNGIRDMYGH